MPALQFQSFQKVWMTPSEAIVFQADGDELRTEPTDSRDEDDPRRSSRSILQDMGLGPGKIQGYTTKSEIDVQCEADLIARKESLGILGSVPTQALDDEVDFSLDLFRRIVLPRIEEEVNEGEHFAEMRQVYSAMVLATWIKRAVAEGGSSRLRAVVDSGNPESINMEVTDITRMDTRKGNLETAIDRSRSMSGIDSAKHQT